MSEPAAPVRRIRVTDFYAAKRKGERWAMLTSYDQYTAALFDQAGVWALLVGDSAANNVYGYETTLPVTVDELLPLVRAVVKSTKRAFVIGDLPFGSYEDGPSQALQTSIRFMKEGGCHAVKFEGGVRVAPQIRKVIEAGIPVMGHVGFTPQSEHQLGGYRVQGRGAAAERLLADAHAVEDAGAFSVVLDMAGLRRGKIQRFVKQYANLAQVIGDAASAYVNDVRTGVFPSTEHTFPSSTTSSGS